MKLTKQEFLDKYGKVPVTCKTENQCSGRLEDGGYVLLSCDMTFEKQFYFHSKEKRQMLASEAECRMAFVFDSTKNKIEAFYTAFEEEN